MIERFDHIVTGHTNLPHVSGQTQGDLALVTSDINNPITGDCYVVSGDTWVPTDTYISGSTDMFLFGTANNYYGNKQVLSTPFLFYLGLRPGKTSLDMLTKYFGNKEDFPSTD
jgi:hypothetical protein